MKILYIWDADYPWDIRVDKICKSLAQDGHEVHIASRNLKKKVSYENFEGLHIHRIKPFKNDKLNYIASFPAFFSPIWRNFLEQVINDNNINLIIVRDLPMAMAGIWAGRRYKIPVIFDMAEDYVSLIKDIWHNRKFQGLNLIVRNPYFAKLVEKYTLRNMDQILVVIEEARKLLLYKGVDKDKIEIVGNTPQLELIKSSELSEKTEIEFLEKIKNRYSVVYTGGIQRGRGIQTVLDAIPGIIKKIPDFQFVVIGTGYALNEMKSLCKRNKLDDYVLWLGWVEHSKIFNYLEASKVGIIPHFISDHVNTTIPNKIFDYMVIGLPVLASNSIPMQRIIEEDECGLTFKSGNPDSLANNFFKLYNSSKNYGNNGIAAVKEKYNWDFDEGRLLRVVSNLQKI